MSDDDHEFHVGSDWRARGANCMQDAEHPSAVSRAASSSDRSTATSMERMTGMHTQLMKLSALLPLLLSACIECGNEELSRVPSPSGTRDAVLFSRNCDATTGFNTQLQIVPSG